MLGLGNQSLLFMTAYLSWKYLEGFTFIYISEGENDFVYKRPLYLKFPLSTPLFLNNSW